MQLINLHNIVLNDDLLLVDLETTDLEILHEDNDRKYGTKGVVLAKSNTISDEVLKFGDIVHFSDVAGIYPFKKIDRYKLILHIKEILFESNDEKIKVLEDLTFYQLSLNASNDLDRKIIM